MSRADEHPIEEPLTVDSLRATAASVAAALRRDGEESAARLLDAAVAVSGPVHDQVLALREALVRTRSRWTETDSEVAAAATRALSDAKRLAISL